MRRLGPALALVAIAGCGSFSFAQNINIFTLSGPGITQDSSCTGGFLNCYTLTLGTVDALGVNTAPSFTKIASSSPLGEMFISNATMTIRVGTTYNGQAVTVTAQATALFGHPAVLTGEACTSGCSVATGYTALSGTAATIFTGIESPAITLDVGALVREINGSSAYAGSDTEVVTLHAVSGGGRAGTVRLTIAVSVQTAIIVSSTTFTAGGSTDYTYNFGNVNGLGIGGTLANTKCTAALCPSATLPAVVYYSPQYTFTGIFADFSSTTGTLKAAVTTNFSASAQATLHLCDATASLGTCTALPVTPSAPVTLSSSIADRGTVSRYLGLTVAEINGASAFTGAASATITYTFSVP